MLSLTVGTSWTGAVTAEQGVKDASVGGESSSQALPGLGSLACPHPLVYVLLQELLGVHVSEDKHFSASCQFTLGNNLNDYRGLYCFWLPLLIHKVLNACPAPQGVTDRRTPGVVGRLERHGERTSSSAVLRIPVMRSDEVTSVLCGISVLPPFVGELMIKRQTDRYSVFPCAHFNIKCEELSLEMTLEDQWLEGLKSKVEASILGVSASSEPGPVTRIVGAQ
ncbi:hypothetical protein MG293_014976 [Ovis ammon polii]|uniref:Uncharacterized protein n=1 Tax=Ovis ammon polii TaxID=230172 RepID=A0AAD4Y5H6_OVIAM|nr:hypothetical protein MG293_014976 [Ovis ammon polii]